MDIEILIKTFLKYQDVYFFRDYIYFYSEKNEWIFDNRLFNLTFEFHDILWRFSIDNFKKLYSDIFKTNLFYDSSNIPYLERKYLPNYDYCLFFLKNLMKCSSLYSILEIFKKYVRKSYPRLETLLSPYIDEDSNYQQNFLDSIMKSKNDEFYDKISSLFNDDFSDKDLKNIFNYFKNKI